MAGLEPDSISIRHPATVVRYVGVRNEVLATSATRIEAIGKTVEGSDRHRSLLCESTFNAEPPLHNRGRKTSDITGQRGRVVTSPEDRVQVETEIGRAHV